MIPLQQRVVAAILVVIAAGVTRRHDTHATAQHLATGHDVVVHTFDRQSAAPAPALLHRLLEAAPPMASAQANLIR